MKVQKWRFREREKEEQIRIGSGRDKEETGEFPIRNTEGELCEIYRA